MAYCCTQFAGLLHPLALDHTRVVAAGTVQYSSCIQSSTDRTRTVRYSNPQFLTPSNTLRTFFGTKIPKYPIAITFSLSVKTWAQDGRKTPVSFAELDGREGRGQLIRRDLCSFIDLLT